MVKSIKALTILYIIIVTMLILFVSSIPALAAQDAKSDEILAHARALDLIIDEEISSTLITKEQVIFLLVKTFSKENYPACLLGDLASSGSYESFIASAKEMKLIDDSASSIELGGFISNQEGFSLLAICAGIRSNNFDSLRRVIDNEEISTYAKPYLSALVEGEYLQVKNGYIYPRANAKLIDYLEVIENILYNRYIAD